MWCILTVKPKRPGKKKKKKRWLLPLLVDNACLRYFEKVSASPFHLPNAHVADLFEFAVFFNRQTNANKHNRLCDDIK